MASPQLEHGYLKLANEIAEALARAPLSGLAHRVLWIFFRQTYGRPGTPLAVPLSGLTSA